MLLLLKFETCVDCGLLVVSSFVIQMTAGLFHIISPPMVWEFYQAASVIAGVHA